MQNFGGANQERSPKAGKYVAHLFFFAVVPSPFASNFAILVLPNICGFVDKGIPRSSMF